LFHASSSLSPTTTRRSRGSVHQSRILEGTVIVAVVVVVIMTTIVPVIVVLFLPLPRKRTRERTLQEQTRPSRRSLRRSQHQQGEEEEESEKHKHDDRANTNTKIGASRKPSHREGTVAILALVPPVNLLHRQGSSHWRPPMTTTTGTRSNRIIMANANITTQKKS
jgi:hypothetical protein